MQPFIEFNGEKLSLPQSVDPYKFEVGVKNHNGQDYFILCRKVSKRYLQATGVVLERKGNALDFHVARNNYVQHTFSLEGLEIIKINIDWNAGGSVNIKHEPMEGHTAASEE